MAFGYSPLPEYDAIRKRLEQRFGQQKQEATDAIQRRFAAQGMIGSGAYGKASDEASRQVERDQNDAYAQLDFQEAQEAQRRKEIGEEREFRKSERLGGEQFQRGMFDTDLGFRRESRDADNAFREKEFEENKKTNYIQALIGLADAELDSDQMNFIAGKLSGLGYGPPAGAPGAQPQAQAPKKPATNYVNTTGGGSAYNPNYNPATGLLGYNPYWRR